jgi:hypothetical protein
MTTNILVSKVSIAMAPFEPLEVRDWSGDLLYQG